MTEEQYNNFLQFLLTFLQSNTLSSYKTTKISILDVWHGSGYTSDTGYCVKNSPLLSWDKLPIIHSTHMMTMMMMMNYFCGMVDRRKAFNLISSRGHCQRSSPSRISDMPQARFDPAQNLGSGLVEWSRSVVISTTPEKSWKEPEKRVMVIFKGVK